MFYLIVIEDGGQIVDCVSRMSDAIIQAKANEFQAAVYAICSVHSGYSATPAADGADEDAQDGIVAVPILGTLQADRRIPQP